MKIIQWLLLLIVTTMSGCAIAHQDSARETTSISTEVTRKISACIVSGCPKVKLSRVFQDAPLMKTCLLDSLSTLKIQRVDLIESMAGEQSVPLFFIRAAQSCAQLEITISIEQLKEDDYSEAYVGAVLE